MIQHYAAPQRPSTVDANGIPPFAVDDANPSVEHASAVRRKPGRLKKPGEIREHVIKLAAENPGWGYTKIRDALRGLKVELERTTVANIPDFCSRSSAPITTQKDFTTV